MKKTTKKTTAKPAAKKNVSAPINEEEVKAVETKAEEVKTAETKAEEVKAAETKTAKAAKTTKTTKAAKSDDKETKAVKAADTTELILEYQGANASMDEIVKRVKEAYAAGGNKVSDIKSLKIYIKPEDYTAYYVINDNAHGGVRLF